MVLMVLWRYMAYIPSLDLLAVVGTNLGFVIYKSRAKIFMGDVGSCH